MNSLGGTYTLHSTVKLSHDSKAENAEHGAEETFDFSGHGTAGIVDWAFVETSDTRWFDVREAASRR